jgi:AcrR family transcriptional regulator
MCILFAIESLTTPRRRERLRTATLEEIKSLAWVQIAESGPAALSLRAIARGMGMTSSALYRYYESRDQLLDALARDAFASLADALEEAERLDGAFLPTVRAYRRWALDHPTEYAVMFGLSAPSLGEEQPLTLAEMLRGVNVLFRCMTRALEGGQVHPPPLTPSVEKRLRRKLRKWTETAPYGMNPEAQAACMYIWIQLHGAISLELAEHLPPDLLPADELFEHVMSVALRAIGGPAD